MKFKKTFKALALLLGVTSIIAGCGANNSSALKKVDVIEKQVYNFALVKDDFSNEENYFTDLAVDGLERIKKNMVQKLRFLTQIHQRIMKKT